jgi:5-methylcytosine-specific restriction endonuclease McrA
MFQKKAKTIEIPIIGEIVFDYKLGNKIKLYAKSKKRKLKKSKTIKQLADDLEKEEWKPRVFKKWSNRCLLCGKKAVLAHHFYPKQLYRALRFNISNGVPLCKNCHFTLHKKDPTLSNKITDKRGLKWYSKLRKEMEKKREVGYNKKWIEDEKNKLINIK